MQANINPEPDNLNRRFAFYRETLSRFFVRRFNQTPLRLIYINFIRLKVM
ncbi:hypothetical protein ACTMNS_12150 [Staphylococcus haemolyticus]